MANSEHLIALKQGTKAWNKWRKENSNIKPDLRRAKLGGADLSKADLSKADLQEANLSGAILRWADLSDANLSGADIGWANCYKTKFCKATLNGANFFFSNLVKANLKGASLEEATLRSTNFYSADLRGAILRGSDLTGAALVESKLNDADLFGCRVYGISAWNLKINKDTKQLGLVITKKGEPIVTVDDIKLAQFIYFILTNKEIRNVINTVANKAVLILGRFTKKRKEVLDAIADKLRTMDLVPIIFDFIKPEEQDIIETVITLASISKFIIADVTAARVIADELRSFVPNFAVPVVPVFHPSKKEPKPYASLYTLHRKYTWVFKPVLYKSKKHLIEILPNDVITPAEIMRSKLRDINNDDS